MKRKTIVEKGLVGGIVCLMLLLAVPGAGAITGNAAKLTNNVEHLPLSITVAFTHPENAIYWNDHKIAPFFVPLVLRGPIGIECTIEPSDEIDMVEYYVNGVLCYINTEPPFFWPYGLLTWGSFSKISFAVIAYGTGGTQGSDEITIYRIFP